MYSEVSVAAPAQIANIFGFFDCAGLLCRPPPRTEESRTGGMGDIITVEVIPDQSDRLIVEYLLRKFDDEGYWGPVEKFSNLAEAIKARPDRDIIGSLVQKTLHAICNIKPDLHSATSQPLKVTVTKCLPAGKVGVGLGSSASSTAVTIAIDKLFGEPLKLWEEDQAKNSGKDPLTRLQIMAEGEKLVSGARFFDNVAPLFAGGLVFISDYSSHLAIRSLNWPRHLHVVTITPDLSLETQRMRELVRDASAQLFDVAADHKHRLEVMLGLFTNDVERITRFVHGSLIENVRWPAIERSRALIEHVEQRRRLGFHISLGISGSGPTVYCLADSEGLANQIGEELHEIWHSQGIMSWWLVQQYNPVGVDPFHVR